MSFIQYTENKEYGNNKVKAYHKTSTRERYCLENLFDTVFKNKDINYELIMSSTFVSVPYDAILKIYDGEILVNCAIIEVKVREDSYPDYFLEAEKLRNLKNVKKELDLKLRMVNQIESDILYINFTPNSSLIWSILEMRLPKQEERYMNSETINSRKKKVKKKVYCLKPHQANYITKYIYDKKKFESYYLDLTN